MHIPVHASTNTCTHVHIYTYTSKHIYDTYLNRPLWLESGKGPCQAAPHDDGICGSGCVAEASLENSGCMLPFLHVFVSFKHHLLVSENMSIVSLTPFLRVVLVLNTFLYMFTSWMSSNISITCYKIWI